MTNPPVTILAAILALAAAPSPGNAQAHRLHYTARLLGVPLLDISYCIALDASHYTSAIEARTVGVIDLVWHGQSTGFADGGITDKPESHVQPSSYQERGKLGGEANQVRIDYAGGEAVLREMSPPQSKYRTPIPPAMLHSALDGLSAIALELLTATRTKACQGVALVYDGFQLRRGTTQTAGTGVFSKGPHNIFSGNALQCDTVSEQLAGFMKNRAEAPQRRPRHSSVWLAPLTQDGLYLPLRLAFDADFLGDITVDLDHAGTATACAAPG